MIRWKKDWVNRDDGMEPQLFCPMDVYEKLQSYQLQMQFSVDSKIQEIPEQLSGYDGLIYTPAPDRWIYSENYTDGKVLSRMPENIFQDGFGYEVKGQIKQFIKAYYEQQTTAKELRESFLQTCILMRQYRNEVGQTTGQSIADNMQIVGQVYEMYAKENQRAARRANYAKGCAINGKFAIKDKRKQKDWCYYYALYYYICEDVGVIIQEAMQVITEKWEIPLPDIEAIEQLSKIDLRGGRGFNCSWNSLYPNQISRVYMRDEMRMPPEKFQFFYKEFNPGTGKGILVIGFDDKIRLVDVPFNSFLGNPRGQIYNAGELVKLSGEDTEEYALYNQCLENFSIFTRRYAHEA